MPKKRTDVPPQGAYMANESPYTRLAISLSDFVLQETLTEVYFHEQHWNRNYDSPIESVFGTALLHTARHNWVGGVSWELGYRKPDADLRTEIGRHRPGTIIVQRQVQLDGWRVDFLISQLPFEATDWRKLIVECDGHEFHERTKEQAAKDRSRDRAFQAKGFEVFRFTGSELWKDPMKCAIEVLEWAREGA